MTETDPLAAEIRGLASLVAASDNDDVADLGGSIADLYERERFVALGLIGVDAMVSGDCREHDEFDPRLVAVRERMRDRLKGLLAWAQASGRL